jgi:hypothetical protein
VALYRGFYREIGGPNSKSFSSVSLRITVAGAQTFYRCLLITPLLYSVDFFLVEYEVFVFVFVDNVEYCNVEYCNFGYCNVEYCNVEYCNVEYCNVEY